jgi:hypothetical protein
MKYDLLLENWNKFLQNNEKSVVLIDEQTQTLTPAQFAANIVNVAKSPVSKAGAEQETKKIVSDPNNTKQLGELIRNNNFFGAIKFFAQILKGDDAIELAKVVNLLYPASKQPLKGQVSEEQVNPITFASSAAQRALVNIGNGDLKAGLNKFTGYSAFIVLAGMILTNLMVAWQNKDTSSARDALELIPHLKNSLSLSKSGDLLNFLTDTSSTLTTESKKKKKGDRCTRIAKRKYKVWPSAYASGAVVKCRQGKIWKGISEDMSDEQIDDALLLEALQDIELIQEEWSEKYKRSINCKNPKGFSQRAHCQGRKKKLNEIAVYHGSAQDFDTFNPEKAREFGFHFGTLESAKHRNPAFVKQYEIDINNPLELDDVGFWEPASILENMVANGYIEKAQQQDLLQQINSQAIKNAKASGTSLRYEKNEILKSKLEEMNYDGIIYENRGESGDTAYIVFRPEQAQLIQTLEEAKKKRAYKPNFSREKKQGLHGWFARNKGKGWINCRTGGPCGRSDADSGGKYPACRPTKAQCKSAGKGPLRKKKSSKPISWTKKKKKED